VPTALRVRLESLTYFLQNVRAAADAIADNASTHHNGGLP
jgi:hypothetical protein